MPRPESIAPAPIGKQMNRQTLKRSPPSAILCLIKCEIVTFNSCCPSPRVAAAVAREQDVSARPAGDLAYRTGHARGTSLAIPPT